MRAETAEGSRPLWVAAASMAVVLWSCEAMLARISSHPQTLRDIVESLLGLVLLGAVPIWLFTHLPIPQRQRAILLGFAAAAPLALVTYAILLPATLGKGRLLALGAPLGVALALGAWRALRSESPVPGSTAVAGIVAGAALFTWGVHIGSLPPLSVLSALAVVFTAVAWLGRTPIGVALLLPITALGALVPRVAEMPEWTNELPVSAGADRPDIVLFSVDTLRADVGIETAAYREIAAKGVAFPNTQAAAPWTLPSMATIFTGVRPSLHGAGHLADGGSGKIIEDLPTLAQFLERNGYDTAGISTNDFLEARRGFERGFSWFFHAHDALDYALPRAASDHASRPAVANLLMFAKLEGRSPRFDAGAVSKAALAVIDSRRDDRPLFLWVHYMDCHLPYAHAEEAELSRRAYIALERGNGDIFENEPYWQTSEGAGWMKQGMRNEARHVDRSILSILEALGPPSARGRVVVFVADHGEAFWEHGVVLHGRGLHQELVGVPLAISGLSGRQPGTVEEAVVGHRDLFATLLAAAGVPRSEWAEGREG